jgi:hypothetical protein
MTTGNDAANLLIGLETKLLSNVTGAVLGSTAGGWVAALIGYGLGTPQTPSISNVLSALGQISTALGDMAQNLENLDQTIINNDDASNLATAVAYAMDPVKNKDASEFDHDDIVDIRNHSSYLLDIHNTQMGNLPGSAGPFLANWIDKYAPQFYVDSVQMAIIHEQFDYYQQAQLLMTNLLLEAYHFGDPATEDDPPRPPRYGSARTVLSQYAAQVQEQSTWLPLPNPLANTAVPLPNVFDRENGVAWLTQNSALTSGCKSIPALRSGFQAPGLLALPTLDQLKNLNKNLSTYGAAYDKIRSQPGSTLSASPGCEDYLNAFGFDVKFGNAPVAAAESMDSWNWVSTKKGDFAGYECNYFFDVANNRQMTVFVGVNASDANSHDPIENMASATMALCHPPGSDDATSLDKSAYADVLPIVLYRPTDPAVEEPVSIEIQVSEISVTATGMFERTDPSSGKLTQCGIDITRYVYWQVSDPTVATISNSPDSIGKLTWLKSTGSVTVTAMRHRPASPSKLNPSANPSTGPNISNALTLESQGAAPDYATGINIYPRDTGFTSVTSLPAQGMRIYVQRIHGYGDPDDDITNGQCLLKADSPSLQFTDPPNAAPFGLKSGTFNIDATAPPSSTITITAQDGFENGGTDTLTLNIRGAAT